MELVVKIIDFCIYSWLIFIAVVDVKRFIVSNKSILILSGLICIRLFLCNTQIEFTNIMYGIMISAIIFGGLFFVGRGFIGGGDVKLALILSLWLGTINTVIAIYIAFILGGIIGVFCLLFHLKSRKDKLPFVPMLVLGAIIAHTLGQNIIVILNELYR